MYEDVSESEKEKTITYLDLSNRNITSLESSFFNNFPNLEYLDLSKNALHTLPEDIFSNNSKLTVINLCKNRITTLPENIFENTLHLQELYVCCNYLKELPFSLMNLKNLRHISFHSNPILYIDTHLDYFLQSIFFK